VHWYFKPLHQLWSYMTRMKKKFCRSLAFTKSTNHPILHDQVFENHALSIACNTTHTHSHTHTLSLLLLLSSILTLSFSHTTYTNNIHTLRHATQTLLLRHFYIFSFFHPLYLYLFLIYTFSFLVGVTNGLVFLLWNWIVQSDP